MLVIAHMVSLFHVPLLNICYSHLKNLKRFILEKTSGCTPRFKRLILPMIRILKKISKDRLKRQASYAIASGWYRNLWSFNGYFEVLIYYLFFYERWLLFIWWARFMKFSYVLLFCIFASVFHHLQILKGFILEKTIGSSLLCSRLDLGFYRNLWTSKETSQVSIYNLAFLQTL